jgi:hypothetical protein
LLILPGIIRENEEDVRPTDGDVYYQRGEDNHISEKMRRGMLHDVADLVKCILHLSIWIGTLCPEPTI